MNDILDIEPGDQIRVKIACRYGWVAGWRIVRTVSPITIHAYGWKDFIIHPREVLEVRKGENIVRTGFLPRSK
jgi:hypothetical protein